MSARRTIRGLAAIVTIVAIIGGVPLLLLAIAGSPIPPHLPGWQHLGALLTQRNDTGSVFVALVRDLTWLAWLTFSAALVTELQAAARGRLAPRLHLGGLQAAAARLAAIAALAFSAPTGVSLASAGAAGGVTLPAAIPGHDATAVRPAAAGAAVDASQADVVYTVQPGDCLWTIAEHYLGAGDLYPEIANLNIGHVMNDGVVFTNPSLIYPGWQLAIPVPGSPRPNRNRNLRRAEHWPSSRLSASTPGTTPRTRGSGPRIRRQAMRRAPARYRLRGPRAAGAIAHRPRPSRPARMSAGSRKARPPPCSRAEFWRAWRRCGAVSATGGGPAGGSRSRSTTGASNAPCAQQIRTTPATGLRRHP
jgi:LysM domain